MALLPPFPGRGSFPDLPDLQLGDHVCLPVGGDAERLSGIAGVAELGLRSGGQVAVFTDTETPDEMAAYLVARVPGAGSALAAGQLVVLACRDFHLAGGAFDPVRTVARYVAQIDVAEEQGYAGLWIVVDMAWALSGLPGTGLLLDYEAGANPGFADQRVAAVCVYDRSRFCPVLLEKACSAHPLTPGQARLRFARTTDPPGLALSGEVDLTNHRAFSALLTALQPAPGHITIDATGLRFADLRAADLLWAASSTRARGTTTITGSPLVNRLLELVGNNRSATGGQPDA